MAPYDEGAEIYLMGGLRPIPIFGKATPVSGATGYEGTVTDEKIMRWLDSDPLRRARAGRGASTNNLGIRHEGTLSIDVDQGYGGKDGVAQLAEFARKRGLDPLPATWSSTSRGDDSPSRQHVYRVAEDVKFRTKPCKSVELCCRHHRYTVCAPSVHPDTGNVYAWYLPGEAGVPPTWGERTTRYPRLDDFTELPAEWFAAFRGGVANADRSLETVELPDLLNSFPQGAPDEVVQKLIDKWAADADPVEHVGHDQMKDAGIHCILLGREGHTGVPELFRLLVSRFTAYVNEARPRTAKLEISSLVDAVVTIGQQKPLKPWGPAILGRMVTDEPTDDAGSTASTGELNSWVASFTANQRPHRLTLHTAWMVTDPPRRLPHHAERMVAESILGSYPAEAVVTAIAAACQHHGILDPTVLLAHALDSVLTSLQVVA